jgi:hypothetical protein
MPPIHAPIQALALTDIAPLALPRDRMSLDPGALQELQATCP